MNYFTLYKLLILLVFFGKGCNFSGKPGEETQHQDAPKDELLEKFTERIEANPNNDKLYIERANYYLTIDEVDLALRDIIFAIDINDKNPDHYITLSETYLALGNPDRCLEGLDKALELDPVNQEALLKKAQLFLIMQQYDKTYETIKELIGIDNFNPTAYYVRGYALIEQGDTVGAIRNFLTAVDQKQDYYEAYMQLGIVYSVQKNSLAADYLSNAIELKPESPEAYYQLGLYYQENDHIIKAIETYNRLREINPEYIFAIYNLGYIHLVYLQEFDTAIDYFSQVIHLDPEQFDAWYNRGYSYELMGNKEMARKDYLKALEVRANYPLAIEGLNRLD
ncbi:MAG: tetratricopeptide repeat protein [Bacteroidales bacterium]|nr:tetratricopeptide repeat protein [Bacteroidales bacterium]